MILDVISVIWLIFTSPPMLIVIFITVLASLTKWLFNSFDDWKIKQEIEQFNKRARLTGVEATDNMTGLGFERWLRVKFEQMGYPKVVLLRYSKDKGADLLITTTSGQKIAVQAKKSSTSNIGVRAIGEVMRAMKYYDCDLGIVVTNQYFTNDALEEIKHYKDIVLWDRTTLIQKIEKADSIYSAKNAAHVKKSAERTKYPARPGF